MENSGRLVLLATDRVFLDEYPFLFCAY